MPGSTLAIRRGQIFTVCGNPAGCIIAAIFGLTPGILFTRLRQQAEDYKNELKDSGPSDSGTTPQHNSK